MFQICLSYSQARKGKKFTVEIIVMEIKQEKKTKKKVTNTSTRKAKALN